MSHFRKRVFTTQSFFKSLVALFNGFTDLKKAYRRKLVDRRFTERIILAVTQVNQCRFCSFGHTQAALSTGMSNQEIDEILNADFENVPKDQKLAMCFAQYFAEHNGVFDQTYLKKLVAQYGTEATDDILAIIKFITFGNLCGNTLEAFLLRFTGRKIPESSIFHELVVIVSSLTILPLLLLFALIFK